MYSYTFTFQHDLLISESTRSDTIRHIEWAKMIEEISITFQLMPSSSFAFKLDLGAFV